MSRSYFFSAPRSRLRAGMYAGTGIEPVRASQHFPSPRGMGAAVSAWRCGSIDLFYLTMLVREPVHGMQGLLERQRMGLSQNLVEVKKTSTEWCRPFKFYSSPCAPGSSSKDTHSNAAQIIVTRTRQGRHGLALFKGRGWSDASPANQDGGTVSISRHAARPSDELPKKTMHEWDKCRLR